MQWQRPIDLPGPVIQNPHGRFFLIELVLDLAHQLFEDILECHHADRAAVLVHHHRQVQLALQKQLQHPLEPRRGRHINQLARHRQQLRRRARLEPHRVEILDMNHPERLVQITLLTDWKPRVARLLRDVQALRQALIGR